MAQTTAPRATRTDDGLGYFMSGNGVECWIYRLSGNLSYCPKTGSYENYRWHVYSHGMHVPGFNADIYTFTVAEAKMIAARMIERYAEGRCGSSD